MLRVWNTLLSQWDDVLEKQLVEKELMEWQKKYLTD